MHSRTPLRESGCRGSVNVDPKCALNRWPPAASSAAKSAHDLRERFTKGGWRYSAECTRQHNRVAVRMLFDESRAVHRAHHCYCEAAVEGRIKKGMLALWRDRPGILKLIAN